MDNNILIKMNNFKVPIYKLNNNNNNIYIMRDDLLPFSFGGNKARKAINFYKDIIKNESNCIVTYGSSSSNHCRIIANIANIIGIPCYIISPLDNTISTFNSKLNNLLNARVVNCDITEVGKTIDSTLNKLKNKGFNVYFVPAGGHGNLGTQAYVDAYSEIMEYENDNNINFDYIFHASGTGTTQAGLICGKIQNKKSTNIIGISIAREREKGALVVEDSIKEYLDKSYNNKYNKEIYFIDNYICGGYGKYSNEILDTIRHIYRKEGIPLDATYTGKAFCGMNKYIKSNNIENKNILFIHTGGTPLFFNNIDIY